MEYLCALIKLYALIEYSPLMSVFLQNFKSLSDTVCLYELCIRQINRGVTGIEFRQITETMK